MNLIGISGKLASGKNTVADIIQYLIYCDQHKDDRTFYYPVDVWLDEMKDGYLRMHPLVTGWEEKMFAGKLKDIVCLLIGCTREQLEQQDFKHKELGEEWTKWRLCLDMGECNEEFYFGTKDELHNTLKSKYCSFPNKNHDKYETYFGNPIIDEVKMTPRLLLQLFGTQCGREIIHPLVWINSLFADHEEDSKWIVTDMRFQNELEAVEERNGITMRVNRPSIKRPSNEHESETALDGAKFKYTIENDGTIEDLVGKVKVILKKEKII